MASNPIFGLSERAAAALRPLIAPGSTYGARKRPAHNVTPDARPSLFDLRVVPGGSGSTETVQIYLGEDADLRGPNNAVRVNGLPVAFTAPAGTPSGGWYPIGASTSVGAVWIVFSASTVAGATNWAGYGSTLAPVTAQVAATLAAEQPPTPSLPDDRAFHRLLLWYRPGQTSWASPGDGPWTRCVQGGADITIDLADGDPASAIGSVEHPNGGPVALRSFSGTSADAWPSSPTSYDLVVRRRTSSGNVLVYLPVARVAWIDSTGRVVVGSDVYEPQQVTINGQTLTILVKQ